MRVIHKKKKKGHRQRIDAISKKLIMEDEKLKRFEYWKLKASNYMVNIPVKAIQLVTTFTA